MKKFLSLVLALIMTMSLVTISAGATEYKDLTDKDEIEYEEAVAVLNRIGVITGYDDGSFRPETELTRGAAAKIIVSLLIGPEAANNLPNTTAPYPDVPASHTFAGVISYCKTAGIISGYGDGTFKPANSLTGFAFAKMLLGALGYNSQVEGFVDTGWTMNVAKVGNVTGLFDRLDFDGAGAVSREVACQLALNTLKATMVTYGGTTVVTGAQTLAVQGTQAMYVTSNNRDINANINRRVISATNNELTLEFGEEHFKDLRLEHDRYDPAYDIYGHPSNEWSYKKVTIGTFKLPADFTYTKRMAHIEDTQATKEKALDLRGYDTYSTDHRGGYVNWSTAASNTYGNSPFADATQIHINGWKARVLNTELYKQTLAPKGENPKKGQWYSYDAFDIGAANKDLAPSLSEICDLTDNGVTVEVYVCPVDADFITDVVVTRTQLMEVDRIASDYVDLAVIDSDSKDPRDEGDLSEIAGYNDYSLFDKVASVKDNNYDPYNVLKDLKSGDEVAVIPYTADDGKTWEVGEAYVPETVSGALTNVNIYNTRSKADGNAIEITVGGTTYPIAQWNLDMREITTTKIRATKKDVTLLLDKDGNALRAKDVGASDDWIIVGDYYQATLTNGRVGWYVHGWTIKGNEVDLELGTIRGAAEKYAPGELVKYQVASAGNGEYELVKPMYQNPKGVGPTNGRRVLKDGTLSPWVEPTGAKVTEKGKELQTGEGVYNVSQYAKYNSEANPFQQYQINSRNTLIPLEFYDTDRRVDDVSTATGVHKDYRTANSQTKVGADYADGKGATDSVFYTRTARYNKWTYRTTPYDGVKFIFVGFDSGSGEVDTINVLDGVQNVKYDELIQINRWWRNVGTNTDSFVASPAEAYVDKNGKVKAVVIKSDSAEANLKDLIIITDNRGTYTKNDGGAEAPTASYYRTYQYVTGEDGFKEEKTGYFDRDLDVGTVLIGRLQSNGVFKTSIFHKDIYEDRNPDGLYVKGIKGLYTQENKRSDWGFYVGTEMGIGAAYTLGTGVNPGDYTLVAEGDTAAKILTNTDVLGLNGETVKKGLIKVDSATQFLDLRDGRPGDITELGDLFDDDKCDSKTVELKVILNGNESSDGFRHAYAIMVLWAKPVGDNAATADVTITGRTERSVGSGNFNKVVAAKSGNGSEKTPYVYEVAAGEDIQLTAAYPSIVVAENPTWTDITKDSKVIVSTNNVYVATAGLKAGDVQKLMFTVTNFDTNRKDVVRAESKVYVNVVAVAQQTDGRTGSFGIIRNDAKDAYVATVNWKVLSTSSSASYIDMWIENWPAFLPAKAKITGQASADIGTAKIGAITASPAGDIVLEKGKHTTALFGGDFTAAMSISDANDVTDISSAGTKRFAADFVNYKFVGTDTASNAVAALLSIKFNTNEYGIATSSSATQFTGTAGANAAEAIFNGSGQTDSNVWVTAVDGGTATVASPSATCYIKTTKVIADGSGNLKVQADGNDFVTFTVGTSLSSTTAKVSVANSPAKFDLTKTNTDGTLTYDGVATPAKNVTLTAGTTSGITAGGAVGVTVAVTDADAAGYDVTVTVGDQELLKSVYIAAGGSETRQLKVDADVDLADAEVTVVKHEKIKIMSASMAPDKLSMEITLNVDVDVASGVSFDTTAAASKVTNATNAPTGFKRIGEKVVQVTWTSGSEPGTADSNTVVLGAGVVTEKGCAGNANGTLTITFKTTPDTSKPEEIPAIT